MIKSFIKRIALVAICLTSSAAFAGPFILSGTDADDHGYASGGANIDGWFFMQRALENIGNNVTNGNTSVVILGSTSSAGVAANSAFSLSGLTSLGWTASTVSTSDFGSFFDGSAATNINNAGIIMMDSGRNVSGGVDGSNFTSYATAINAFVGGGGGLFSQANGYDWLSTLLPSVTTTSEGSTGISLTAAGNTAFPGLTDADLSAGPHHNSFNDFAPIASLGVNRYGHTVIIGGGGGGSITDPDPDPNAVPEPGTLALFGLALTGLVFVRRRKTA